MKNEPIVICLRKAVFDRMQTSIGGGIFEREELKQAADTLEQAPKLLEELKTLLSMLFSLDNADFQDDIDRIDNLINKGA